MSDHRNKVKGGKILGFGIVIGVAVFLRLLKLGEQGLFLDEALSWLHSQFPVADLMVILRHLNHTPLYFFLLKIYLIFVPQTEFWLRSLSVIFSLLSLLVVIWLTRRWWGGQAAFFAGWLIAISSFDIYYAQDVRMYTMLSFFWLVSCALLLEIVRGRSQLLILWGIVLVLASQTHVYGLILAFVQCVFVGIVWVLGFISRSKTASSFIIITQQTWSWRNVSLKIFNLRKELMITWIIVALGVLPIILALFQSTAWRVLGGGVWIPTWMDFPKLFVLASVGLTALRGSFLDGGQLVLPWVAAFPFWGWILVGIGSMGFLAILGGYRAWMSGAQHRWMVGVLLISSIAPIVIVWLIGVVLRTNTWAYKSFLGAVILFYLLAGIGLSSLQRAWMRWGLIVLISGIALLSLIPYYTVWNKDPSAQALGSLPYDDQRDAVLMERAYMSPLAHFYLGTDAQVIGLSYQPDAEYPFLDTQFGSQFMYGYDKISCQASVFQAVSNVWIYGDAQVVRERLRPLPDCFSGADLWIFENGGWQPFER